MEEVGVPLKAWDVNISRGVLTGCNEAFVISTEKRNEILACCKTSDELRRTEELIRPILRGRDIKRYSAKWAGLWLISTFPSRRYDINLYPAVERHLLSFAEPMLRKAGMDWIADNYLADFCYQKLSQTGKFIEIGGQRVRCGQSDEKSRKETSNKWFETQDSINYWDDFSRPKIMYPNMTKFLPFYLDTKGYYQNDKSFLITGKHLAFLTAFLNSSLFKFCYIDNFPELQGGTRELRKIFFDKIKIIQIDDSIEQVFKGLVSEMQKQPSKTTARKIDDLLFDIYELTKEERELVGFIEIE